MGGERSVYCLDKVCSLCATDYKGLRLQGVQEGKWVIEMENYIDAYPQVGEGVVDTIDAHYSAFPGCRGGMERTMVYEATGVDMYNQTITGDKTMSITGAATDSHHIPCAITKGVHYVVRRLTPTEAERLQAFPDGWTDIGDWVDSKGRTRKTTDSNRYKALGNSICTEAWVTPLERISKILASDGATPTMASLFDGIGGFPLVWERINGKGSCVWASEIEDFAIAVTERRINSQEEQDANH